MTTADLGAALRLLVITDRGVASPRPLADVVRAALEGGARAVQLRNKGEITKDLLATGEELRRITRDAGALLFVNDRIDIALAVEADGVHVGPDDLPVAAIRAATPDGFLIGCSADDPAEAQAAVRAGADYIGCGTVFPTETKPDAGDVIGLEGLERVVRAVDVPVLAVGGISVERAGELSTTGAAGVAVVSAIMSAADPADAARSLLASLGAR